MTDTAARQIATAENIEWGADFFEHRIQGQAHQDRLNRWFDVPLASHVEGNLWQGGCWPGVKVPDEFVHVFSLYPWEQYARGPSTELTEVKMYDSSEQGFEQVDALAGLVVEAMKSGPVLVHCQAGRNRSGLVAARVLMLLGDSAATAINKVRKRSQVVLCNESFTNWLHGLD